MSPTEIEETERLLNVMLEEVTEQMGAENIVSASIHWDESHPHVQMLVVPATSDGQVSMKQVLGGAVPGVKPTKATAQKRYSDLHDSMRHRLIANGYEATMERVSSGKRHLGLTEFKAEKDRVRAAEAEARAERQALKRERVASDRRAAELTARAAALDARADDLDWREAELPHLRTAAREEGREAGKEAARVEVATDLAAAALDRQRAAEELQRAEQQEKELAAMKKAWAFEPSLEGEAMGTPVLSDGTTVGQLYEQALARARAAAQQRTERVARAGRAIPSGQPQRPTRSHEGPSAPG